MCGGDVIGSKKSPTFILFLQQLSGCCIASPVCNLFKSIGLNFYGAIIYIQASHFSEHTFDKSCGIGLFNDQW
jgi:hypothetical protein